MISGALRGAGKQVLGAVTNFICYYIVGLPIGICLALLANLGVMGMWIGIGIADTLQVKVHITETWIYILYVILDHCLHWLSAGIQLEKIIGPGKVPYGG